jgi:hypothetical protein
MKLRLFENFQENPNEFSDKIGRSNVNVDLYDEPAEIKYGMVQEGKVTWYMYLETRSWGVEFDGAGIKEMYFDIEVDDDENEDTKIISIEVPEDSISSEKTTYELGKFPLSLESIEIHMNHTMDPEFWKVTLYIGNND